MKRDQGTHSLICSHPRQHEFGGGEKERRTTPLTREVEVIGRHTRSLRGDESILGRVPVSIVVLDGIPNCSVVSRVVDESSESSVVLLSKSHHQ